jgi:hypothetical protein
MVISKSKTAYMVSKVYTILDLGKDIFRMKCKTGQRLIRKWSTAIQNAGKEPKQWEPILFGKREYDVHRKKCKRCKNLLT